MNIFTEQPKTKEDYIREVRSGLVKTNQSAFKRVALAIQAGVDAIYNNSNYTPQEFLDSYGTEAAELYAATEAAATMLMTIDPSYQMPVTGHTPAVINEDSTVTAGELIIED